MIELSHFEVFNAMSWRLARLELLISGYMREKEQQLKLYMSIPTDIKKVVHALYPVFLFKFGEFCPEIFEVNEDKTIIRGKDKSCTGYLIYADLEHKNNIGFNKGVHLWSIEYLGTSATCDLSVGVTTEKNNKLINEWKHNQFEFGFVLDSLNDNDVNEPWIEEGYHSYWDGHGILEKYEIVTIKLNCNNWTVSYFQGKEEIQRDNIKPNRFYHFALLCCGMSSWSHFKTVDTPRGIF